VTASAGYIGASRWSVRGSFGTVLDGALEGDGRMHDIGPGIVGAASASKQWAFGAWFVTGSLGAGVSRTTTREDGGGSGGAAGARQTLIGVDMIRAGVMAGRTFGVASPYVMARGFGGPVYWTLDAMDIRGSDTSHFQLGAGVSVTTASGLSFLLDISALGERSASLGMSYRL
jgi:hypothetical protein